MRSSTSIDTSCARTRLALTDSACARSSSSRCDFGDLATASGGAGHAQQFGERRCTFSEPARAVDGQRAHSATRAGRAQFRLARAVVDQPAQRLVDQYQFIYAGAAAIPGMAALRAAHGLE